MYEELLNESERQSKYVFPKIYIGKATPIIELEMQYVLDKLLDMGIGELKSTLVEIANRKVVINKRKVSVG